MSLWYNAQHLPSETLCQIYNDAFPIEVRHYLAPWLEGNYEALSGIKVDDPAHTQYAAAYLERLIVELNNKACCSTDTQLPIRIRLQEAAAMLKAKYENNPLSLIETIQNCIAKELKLVKEHQTIVSSMQPTEQKPINPSMELVRSLEEMKAITTENMRDVKSHKRDMEALILVWNAILQCHEQIEYKRNHNQQYQEDLLTKKKLEDNYGQKRDQLLSKRSNILQNFETTTKQLEVLKNHIVNDTIITWKQEQRLAGNGATKKTYLLDDIQSWCEALAEMMWSTREQIKQCKSEFETIEKNQPDITHLEGLDDYITKNVLSQLVTSSFIIEKEPPQVMKTNTRFTATVRLLVGGKLNIFMTPPKVKVNIISEAQAQHLLNPSQDLQGMRYDKNNDYSGEILNNDGTMEYNESNRHLAIVFRNMQLRKIKRAEKKGTESVMDEKFALYFQSSFSIGAGELCYKVWTLSLPVVVIVHGNQEPHAWATISWDNAFSDKTRMPFSVPDQAPWGRVADMLNSKFKYSTGRELSQENLDFLATKALRTTQNVDKNQMLSWSQFCKDPLPERSFTFWEWFFAVMKVTREHLKKLWEDNLIIGFISRQRADEILMASKEGTFLLRFSDSELGGVTIACLDVGGLQVVMLQPFRSSDFAVRTMADRINDVDMFRLLYPSIPKDEAFGQHYTQQDASTNPSNGYVGTMLRNVVPELNRPLMAMSIADSNPTSVASVSSQADAPGSVTLNQGFPENDPALMEFLQNYNPELEQFVDMMQ